MGVLSRNVAAPRRNALQGKSFLRAFGGCHWNGPKICLHTAGAGARIRVNPGYRQSDAAATGGGSFRQGRAFI